MVAVDPLHEDSMRMIRTFRKGLDSNRLDFRTFTAKVNIDYRGGDGKNYNVNATLRMYHDSAIWVSANALLGIEAMRVLITKDSVKLLDKLNKVYTARSVDYLQEVTALPLDLYTLQDLIVGNVVFADTNIIAYSQRGNEVSLLSIGAWFKNLLTVDAGDKRLIRSKLDDVDLARSRTADLTYDSYETKEGFLFASKRTITVSEKSRLDIKLDFRQYEKNTEVSFPFSIPRNYDRN